MRTQKAGFTFAFCHIHPKRLVRTMDNSVHPREANPRGSPELLFGRYKQPRKGIMYEHHTSDIYENRQCQKDPRSFWPAWCLLASSPCFKFCYWEHGFKACSKIQRDEQEKDCMQQVQSEEVHWLSSEIVSSQTESQPLLAECERFLQRALIQLSGPRVTRYSALAVLVSHIPRSTTTAPLQQGPGK